jgi:hypothetical protein
MLKTPRGIAVPVVLAVVLASCGGSGSGATEPVVSAVAAVTVTPRSANLEVGTSRQFSAVATDSAGRTVPGTAVTWTSSNTAVAQVDQSGLVSAPTPGTATITATASGKTGAAEIAAVVSPVASVEILWNPMGINQGDSVRFAVRLRRADSEELPPRPVTWESSDPATVSVSSGGVAHAVARSGEVRITATVEGKSGFTLVTVWWRYAKQDVPVRDPVLLELSNPLGGPRIPIAAVVPSGSTEPLPVIVSVINPGSPVSVSSVDRTYPTAGYAYFQMGLPTPPTPAELSALCFRLAVPSNECGSILFGDRLVLATYVSTLRDSLALIGTRLGVALDSTRVGVFGWSAGGAVTMYLAGATFTASPSRRGASLSDLRFSAFLGLSAPGFTINNGSTSGFESWTQITRPAMQQTSEGDWPERRRVFDDMQRGDKYLVYFDALGCPPPSEGNDTCVTHGTFLGDAGNRFSQFISMSALAFFDAHLRNRAAAREWLTSNQVYYGSRGVGRVQTK